MYERLAESKQQLSSTDDSVKLMTMYSSKGLEFPLVIVAGVGSMPGKQAASCHRNQAVVRGHDASDGEISGDGGKDVGVFGDAGGVKS